MIRVEFKLSMPSNNSWNGKWSGEGRDYLVVRQLPDGFATERMSGADTAMWTHSFGDGWVAAVTARIMQKGEKARKSAGFCGYDWMVDTIVRHGRILNDLQLAQQNAARSA